MDSAQLKIRTKKFSLQIIQLLGALLRTTTTHVIGKQLLRSATSVGANYRAACRSKSKADFLCKINIVEEEADESLFWLELLDESQIAQNLNLTPLIDEANQLTAIFTATGRTMRLSIKQDQNIPKKSK